MKKASIWFENKREKVWFSFLLNALILFGLVLLFRPVYETNDDMGIASMVNGVKGATDAHVLFPHYAVGLLLQRLYALRQSVPWFALLQYLLLYLSFTAITYVLLRRLKQSGTVWMIGILVVWFSYQSYIEVQFSKTAAAAAVAGMLLLFHAVARERLSLPALSGGLLLGCAGYMLRDMQFFAECALMAGGGIYLLFALGDLEKKKRLGRLVRYVGVFGSLLVLALLLRFVNQQCYTSQEWTQFRRINNARRELYDHGFPPWKGNEEKYEALGIDRTAYKVMRNWNQMDTEVYSVETLEGILSFREERTFDKSLFTGYLREIPKGILKLPHFYIFLLMVLYWLLWGRHKARECISMLTEAAVLALLYFYLYYVDRYLVNRVDVGIWLAASAVVLWIFAEGREQFSMRTGAAIAAIVGAVSMYGWRGQLRIRSAQAEETMLQERAVIEYIAKDKDSIYFSTVGEVSFWKSYGVFEAVPYAMAENIFALGGWSPLTPLYSSTLERYEIQNPMRDLIGSDHAYLVTDIPEVMLDYFRAHYKADASAEMIQDFGRYQVYAIR